MKKKIFKCIYTFGKRFSLIGKKGKLWATLCQKTDTNYR